MRRGTGLAPRLATIVRTLSWMGGLLLLGITGLRNRALWVDRIMQHPPSFEIRLVVCKVFLPMLYALFPEASHDDRYRLVQRKPTWSSRSVNPRKSCVRCVAKHPVAKDLAASTPALHNPPVNTAEQEGERDGAYMLWYGPPGPYVRLLLETSYTSPSIFTMVTS